LRRRCRRDCELSHDCGWAECRTDGFALTVGELKTKAKEYAKAEANPSTAGEVW
jgi:hypothetical protein